MPLLRPLLMMLLLAAVLMGCFGAGPGELLDTAQLEEQQNNPTHALELYQEIVSEHPDSEAALVARERIKALEQPTNQ